ncbi:type I glyceraldehyde-3-phosphate dehydrogenase [Candidatus Peregrinibacteria bacterium]|nr:type I glyceraldehyde-3-phosphate dehydrogenase [Candidatus Peregrinibacteria bacterium]
MPIRVAINGYGRIGRGVHRQLIKEDGYQVVAINSRAQADSHAYLLKYDSLYGKMDADIKVEGEDLIVNGDVVKVLQVADPLDCPWKELEVDLVIESTGKFTSREDAEKHLQAGAAKAMITAPCKSEDVPNIVMGVNNKDYSPGEHKIVSNASCTTNCLAPVMKVLNDEFGVETGFVTTIHAFTDSQNLLDNSNPKDFRRARAVSESIIPTTTGAMKAIGRVIPELDGKLDGGAFRIPVPTVSVVDIMVKLNKQVSIESLNDMFKKYESGDLAGYLGTTDEPNVSVDFRGDERSSIVDLMSTKVLHYNYAKIVAWYDNEWGYISRVKDLIKWFTA